MTENIEIINPTADRQSKAGKIASRNGHLDGRKIGLLDNSKPNADKYLEYVGQLLQEKYPGIEIVPRRKMTRTEADCLSELKERCDYVITAFDD
jgi:hypothetical protein